MKRSAVDDTSAGLLVGIAMFTALPVPARAHRRPGQRVLLWFPLIGVAVTALAFVPTLLVWRGGEHGSPLLAAALLVIGTALLTRGMHLDASADLADGLGSRRPADEALEIMRRPEVGAFGVVAIAAALLLQTAALATVLAASTRPEALALAALAACTGRVAALRSARVGVAAAPGSALGVLIAGSVSKFVDAVASLGLVLVAALVGWITGHSAGQAVWGTAASVLALGAAAAMHRVAVRRIGGTNGDLFGAVVELGVTVAIIVLAAATVWR
jgi:adenosylcobinamide-GDP ribazoletransferase